MRMEWESGEEMGKDSSGESRVLSVQCTRTRTTRDTGVRTKAAAKRKEQSKVSHVHVH